MLVTIGLVYVVMLILFRSLLLPFVILCALPLAVIDSFVALAITGYALDLSALIGLPMPSGVVDINAIMLLDLLQHRIEAGDDVCTALIQAFLHALS
jgi:HAE1 family hydrophobic/amphiphilic exporter-1